VIFRKIRENESAYREGSRVDFGQTLASGKDWNNLSVGDTAEESRKAELRDIFSYLGATDDRNPLYLKESYVALTEHGQVIVPSGLLAGWLSAIVSTRLPGPGSRVKELRLSFPHALKQGETVRIRLELVFKNDQEKTVTLRVQAEHDGQAVAEGEIEVIPPRPLKPILSDMYENF
jgi:3-hydroxybutyryl-CoA dehydratase